MVIQKKVVKTKNISIWSKISGCDMILMPVNEEKDIDDILHEMILDHEFKAQVYSSVKKILRLKICLGLI